MATDITLFPQPPATSPVTGTDLLTMGRPTGQLGTSVAYAITVANLAAALATQGVQNVAVTASGVDQGSAAATTAGVCNIIVAGGAGTGVRLPYAPGQTTTVLNSTPQPQLVYPPLVLSAAGNAYQTTSINGLPSGAPATIPPSTEVRARTFDGLSLYVG